MRSEPVDEAGEAACFANLVCASCGVVLGDGAHASGCDLDDPTREGTGSGGGSVA